MRKETAVLVTIRSAVVCWVVLAGDPRTLAATSPVTPAAPGTISDAAHGGNARFFFLPPLVPAPTYTGTFNPTAFRPTSHDEVYVCVLSGATCGARIVRFRGGTGVGAVRVDPSAQIYSVSWPTTAQPTSLNPNQRYRIVVNVGGTDVGYADMVVYPSNARRPPPVDRTQYVVVQLGSTVNIRFRLEEPMMTSIAAGSAYTCTTSESGEILCWGNTKYQSLGFASVRQTPAVVSGSHHYLALGDGGGMASHVCAVDSTLTSYCWGWNMNGEIGDGTTGGLQPTPTLVVGGIAFSWISVGGSHTCGVTLQGAAYCWGDNTYGQLGDGTTTGRLVPTPVSGGLSFNYIEAGMVHTCARTAAGVAYCWGFNMYGQLGDGTLTQRTTPTAVKGGLTIAALSLGWTHTCAITDLGKAYCWGNARSGQLGSSSLGPVVVFPAAVVGNLTFTSIVAGSLHSCGLTTVRAAYCWGENFHGQLGNGANMTLSMTPVPVAGGLKFSRLAAGDAHTCGLVLGGGVYCWGSNGNGQLGEGTTADHVGPTLVNFP